MRLRARDHHTSRIPIGGNDGAGPSSLQTTLEGPTEYDGCKVYMGSYMASNASRFMITWTIFKNHFLDIGLTQNHWETMALQTLTTVG